MLFFSAHMIAKKYLSLLLKFFNSSEKNLVVLVSELSPSNNDFSIHIIQEFKLQIKIIRNVNLHCLLKLTRLMHKSPNITYSSQK